MGYPRPLFHLFKQTVQFLQQIYVKKYILQPVYGAGIRTHATWVSSHNR